MDAVWVADHGSTDATAQVARRLGATVLPVQGTLGAAREAARRACSAQWLIVLDADERLPPGGVDVIRQAISQRPEVAAFTVPIRTHVGQRFLRWGGLYPARRPRVVRREAVRWDPADVVHERPRTRAPTARLALPLDHFSFRDWAHLRAKWRAYANLAANGAPQAVSRALLAVAFRSAWRWIRCYILRLGLLMGRDGLRLANAQAAVPWWRRQAARDRVPHRIETGTADHRPG